VKESTASAKAWISSIVLSNREILEAECRRHRIIRLSQQDRFGIMALTGLVDSSPSAGASLGWPPASEARSRWMVSKPVLKARNKTDSKN
jgi:hypothetical protein